MKEAPKAISLGQANHCLENTTSDWNTEHAPTDSPSNGSLPTTQATKHQRLLGNIFSNRISYNFQSQKYLPHLLYESKRRFYILFQGRTTATQAYLEQFQNMIDVIQQIGGSIGEDSGVEKMILGKKSKDNLSEPELIDLK